MRILLILPYDSTYKYKGFFKRSLSYAPLTLTTLAALVPDEFNAHIDIVDEGVEKLELKNDFYDIVGITCVASSANRAYELAAYFRGKGSFVVLGGSHATLMPEEALKHADAVVAGQGEKAWPELLYDFSKGKAKKVYSCPSTGPLFSPVPRRDLLTAGKYLNVPTIIANRGCSNHCEFCSIHKLSCCCSNLRPVNEVIDEIIQVRAKKILLLDPSPLSNREYAKELFAAMAGQGIKWAGLSTIDIAADEEVFELAVKSGCEGLLVGFESLNQSSLAGCRKTFNSVKGYKEAVAKLHSGGISVLGCFVLGFDDDTLHDFLDLPEIIDELNIDVPRFSVLTPFPGTDLYVRLKKEGRILSEDWSLYDTEHVVFQPQNMTPDELEKALYTIWKRCYGMRRLVKRSINMPQNRLLGLITNLGFRYYTKRFDKS
ncbi:MAG: B12-binding domain-containing radical SAM protein [Clostridiaceae bacterium]|nr:B12-binding domain-containing radical SAM protein [Clostridiaceae bacterium]